MCCGQFRECDFIGAYRRKIRGSNYDGRTSRPRDVTRNIAGISLNPRILSHLEEQQVKAFLKEDGEKNLNARVLALRARKNLPEIRRELELLEKFVKAYEKRL